MDRCEFAIESFKNVQELIRFIDQKAGAVLVIYGFILTAFIDFAKKLDFVNPFDAEGFFSIVHSILTFVFGLCLTSILMYQMYILIIEILRPRLAMNYSVDKKSIYYFEHIASMQKQSYISTFQQLENENELTAEVLEQVYEVSKIMKTKAEKLSRVMNCLYFSIVLLLIFIFLVELF